MLPRFLAAATAVALLSLSACSGGGDDDGDQPAPGDGASPSSTVLDGAERGEAKGSTEEVPFDASVADEGPQDSLTTPAVVLAPDPDRDQTIAAEVTIESVEEREVEGLEVEGLSRAESARVGTYFVNFKVEYVNGPVLRNYELVGLDLVNGERVVSNDLVNFFGYVEGCELSYVVKNFGEGAVLEGCLLLLVGPDSPAPDAVAWTAPVEGAPDPQVTWPLT